MARAGSNSSSGFSLVEVLVSMGLLTVASLAVAQVLAMSAQANVVAKGQTSTTMLAEQKLEQLRALTWGFDASGLPLSDTTTNLAVFPAQPGGRGLNPSPASSLDTNTVGYVDYLDAAGAHIGTGLTPPEGTVYIRRWSIQPLPTNPNNTLVLQVLVTPAVNERSRTPSPGPRLRMPGDARLVSVRTRKAK